MKRLGKILLTSVLSLTIVCSAFAVMAYAATTNGTYSKLVGTNDTSNSRAIATMTNKTGDRRYAELFIYRGNGTMIGSRYGVIAGGKTFQTTSSNAYDKVYAKSAIYHSASWESGSAEWLRVDIKK